MYSLIGLIVALSLILNTHTYPGRCFTIIEMNHDVLIYVVNLFQIKLLTNTGCLKEALIVCQTAVNAHKDVLALWISLLTMMMTNQKETEKIQATLEEAQKVIPKKVRTLIDLHLSSTFFLLFFFFLAFNFCWFCVVILFSSPPQRPMTSDFE